MQLCTKTQFSLWVEVEGKIENLVNAKSLSVGTKKLVRLNFWYIKECAEYVYILFLGRWYQVLSSIYNTLLENAPLIASFLTYAFSCTRYLPLPWVEGGRTT